MIAKSMRFLLIHFLNTFSLIPSSSSAAKIFDHFNSNVHRRTSIDITTSTDEDFRNEGCYRVKIINIPRRGIPLTPSSGDQEVGGRYIRCG